MKVNTIKGDSLGLSDIGVHGLHGRFARIFSETQRKSVFIREICGFRVQKGYNLMRSRRA